MQVKGKRASIPPFELGYMYWPGASMGRAEEHAGAHTNGQNGQWRGPLGVSSLLSAGMIYWAVQASPKTTKAIYRSKKLRGTRGRATHAGRWAEVTERREGSGK